MASLETVLSGISDNALADAKSELSQFIAEGKASSDAFIRESAQKLETWLIDVKNGDMTKDEFTTMVDSQKILAANFIAAQSLKAQKQAEKLTIKTMEIAGTKILPFLLAAI